MNLPVGSECFIPNSNTVILLVALYTIGLSKGHENVAVLESSTSGVHPITSPKPPNAILSSPVITCEVIVPLVLVKVCEPVDSAFYHIKKLPRRNAFALRDLRDLHQSLLAKLIEIVGIVVLLLRRIRHRGDSERKI